MDDPTLAARGSACSVRAGGQSARVAWSIRRRVRLAGATLPAALCALLLAAAPAGSTQARAQTRSIPLARARAAIMRSAPPGSAPEIGRCARGREWTTCAVYERRVLTEEDGTSYPVMLDFQEAVGERAHHLVFVTREVSMSVPRPATQPPATPAPSG